MSSNVQISLSARSLILNLKSFAPDCQLRFTVIRKVSSAISYNHAENGLIWSGGNYCRYTLTPTTTISEVNYYLIILDFSVYHTPGREQSYTFNNEGIRDYSSTMNLSYAMLGNYAFFNNSVAKTNLTMASYWSIRKALPYPILE